MIIALLSTVIFGFVGLLHLNIVDVGRLQLPAMRLEEVQTKFFLYSALFFVLAFLSAQISEKLLVTTRQLVGTHRALDLFQFSAENMMNTLPTGLMFFDVEGKLRFSNPTCDTLLNREVKLEMDLKQVLSEKLIPEELLSEIKKKTARPFTIEFDYETDDNPQLHIQVKALSRQGSRVGYVFNAIDLSHIRRMEKALVRAEKLAAVGEMAARVAHEIRNPLASIQGSAEMLNQNSFDDANDKKLLKLIVTESNRLNRSLTNLLDYTQEKNPTFRSLHLEDLFANLILLLEKNPKFTQKLVKIEQNFDDRSIEFKTDQDILLQALLNLCLNSLDALPDKGGVIRLSGERSEQKVVLEIIDNGKGMDETAQSRAFEPFYTTKSDGSGLGLSTTQHCIQSIEGKIELFSTPGKGTKAVLTLPASPK